MKRLIPSIISLLFCIQIFGQEPTADKTSVAEEMYTKTYSLPIAHWETLTQLIGGPKTKNPYQQVDSNLPWAQQTTTEKDVELFFSQTFGVTFPEGSWLKQFGGSIIMHNTPQNHNRLLYMLALSGQIQNNIDITLRVVSFDSARIEDLERKSEKGLQDQDLFSLWKQGEGKTASLQTVSTMNGVNAIIEMVDEIIYPTSMTVNSNTVGQVIYGEFETRSAGMILNVTPILLPGSDQINLVFLPEIAELRSENKPEDKALAPLTPTFRSLNMTTSQTLKLGSTRVIGRTLSNDGSKEIVFFIRVTQKNPDGTLFTPPDPSVFRD
jgi:hypothetical protein